MPKFVLLSPSIIINSVDLTDHCASVTIDETYNDVDTTGFSQTSKTRLAGLGDHKFTVDFQQDFAASSVEATIYPLIGTSPTVVVKPSNTTTGTTNPTYTFNVLVTEWSPIDGKVGDLLTSSQSWPVNGGVTKAFS